MAALLKFLITNWLILCEFLTLNTCEPLTNLNRKKRYLMFPEGSSFQIVYCLTYPSVAVGTVFVFGHTAALAWPLPTKPFVREENEEESTTTTEMPEDLPYNDNKVQERVEDNNIYNWNYPKNQIYQKTHSSVMDFRYGPINELNSNLNGFRKYENRNWDNYDYDRYYKSSHMRLQVPSKYHSVHRRTRRDLYKRIEHFLNKLNLDGKACLLKTICEIRKLKEEKHTFLEEVFKAIFRSKPHDEYPAEDDYDTAANPDLDCSNLYKTCQGSIRNIQLLLKN